MAEATHRSSLIGRIRARLFGLAIVLLLVALTAISLYSLSQFEHDLVPEMDRKAAAVGESLAADIVRAVDYGVPPNALKGMGPFLAAGMEGHPEIRYLAVCDGEGAVLYHAGAAVDGVLAHFRAVAAGGAAADGRSVRVDVFYDTAVPITARAGAVGTLHVGVDQKFVQKTLEDIVLDILIVLLVSLLVTFELLLFLITFNISGPIETVTKLMTRVENGDFRHAMESRSKDEVGQFIAAFNDAVGLVHDLYRGMVRRADAYRQATGDELRTARRRMVAALRQLHDRFAFADAPKPAVYRESTLVDVRTPLFIFVFAEELSRSFFPIYVRDLFAPVPYLTPEAVIGLPIALFMLFVAIGTPFAGAWTDRYGNRPVFLWGAGLAVVGFLGTALAFNLYDLMAWRVLTAVGYAMATMACQGYIVAITTAENRARGMAVFVGAIMVAAICGTSIGGVLAERLGFRATFFLSAALALVAAAFVHQVFRRRESGPEAEQPKVTTREVLILLRNPRFAVMMLFGAVPAKLILTGFLFYLTPLFLHELGNSQSDIGRGMMVYFAIMVFGNPLCARLADRFRVRAPLVTAGGVLAGGGALVVLLWHDTAAVIGGIAALGLGHSLSTAPLLAMVPVVCEREVRILGQTMVLGVFRILERIGSVAGPFVTAALAGLFGFAEAMAGLGAIVLGSTVVFTLYFLIAGSAPPRPATRPAG